MTSHEIDILIHQKIFEQDATVGGCIPLFYRLPKYSSEIAAAWMVRNKLRSMIFSKRQAFVENLRRIISEEMGCDEGIHHSESFLRVEPHHICMAALKVFGVEVTLDKR